MKFDCSHSHNIRSPSDLVITGDLNIAQNEHLRNVLSHGLNFEEPQHINLNHNFKLIMDFIQDYARARAKSRRNETGHFVRKTIGSHIKSHIHKFKIRNKETVKCLSNISSQ